MNLVAHVSLDETATFADRGDVDVLVENFDIGVRLDHSGSHRAGLFHAHGQCLGTFTLQLVLDEGAWEEVVTVTAEDAEVLQGLFARATSVYYDIPRRTLMFGTVPPGQG